jgi:hypothetical protein
VPVVVTPSRDLSCPTATHSVTEGQFTPFKAPSPVPSSATGLSVDQLQVPDAYVPTVVTPSLALSLPTATHSVTEGQFTAPRPPVTVPSAATGLSVDQLQAPDAYVPTVVTPSSEWSCPTATHSVVEGQLTPERIPWPVPSLATELSVDQLQAPDAYVPMVVTPSPLMSYPAAKHSVIEGQLTAFKTPSPVPSLATGLSVDQLQAPEA